MSGRVRTAGFTLLELLVVIMIITALLSLVAPGLDAVRGRGLAEAADRLCLTLNHARQEAVLTSRPWRLEVDPEEKTLHFQHRLGAEFVPLSKPPFAQIRLQPGMEITELTINGQPVTGSGQVYLLPTGGQDAFSLTLTEGERRRTLAMGSLGAAEVRHP